MSNIATLQFSLRTVAPRLAQSIGRSIAVLAPWIRPRAETPAESTQRMRRLANQYNPQPSFAADLDLYERSSGI